ncbi:hypothetical protein cypCar_00010488 [Cyprinus carpio]|nr:hypothetical protein cypCar_00010488 [Cyprinus carpio]
MADGWCTDTGESVYRSRDAVKNLRIRVRIQRVTSTAALSQHLHQQVLSQQDRGVIELDTFSSQTQAATSDAEELVVGWQEKFFSQYEVDLYQTESNCQTPLERQYHTEIMAMERSKRRQNQRIFTYTDFDRFSKWEEQAQSLLIPAQSTPTFLAERMANVRHRRQERRPVESVVPKSRLITWEPSEEFIKNSHIINTPVQTMHIMGDLGPSGKLGLKENEYILCTIKADGNGVITIKPDFNNNRGAYRQDLPPLLETQGEKREVWRLYLENASSDIHAEEKEREQRMYRDLYTRHKDYLNSLVGQDFEMPPPGILRLIVNGEIDWSSVPFHGLSGVTQTCRTSSVGKEDVAFFSYPFSFETFFHKEDESDEAFQRARNRMQEARETLPRDLINTSAQLNSESSA